MEMDEPESILFIDSQVQFRWFHGRCRLHGWCASQMETVLPSSALDSKLNFWMTMGHLPESGAAICECPMQDFVFFTNIAKTKNAMNGYLNTCGLNVSICLL